MKEFYQKKKILITGHTGFKGSWLSQILVNRGADVVGVSLAPNTTPNLFDTLGLAEKIRNHYICDIRDYRRIKEIFESERPDVVFHLAAQPLVRDSYDDPLKTHSTNIMGTANILQATKEVGGVKSVVVITTDKVYENEESMHPYKESDALGGYDPYSASKAAADIVANSYIQSFFNPSTFGEKHHTLVAIARAGNVIGGGDWGKDRLFVDLIRSVFETKLPMVIRNPKSIRPWQHVLEPLRGYLMLAQQLAEGDITKCGSWNFGPEEESFVCVEEAVKRGLVILGRGEYKIIEDNDKHEANLLKLDISKAEKDLEWRPKWTLSESLKKTFEWYGQFYTDRDKINDLTQNQIKKYFGE